MMKTPGSVTVVDARGKSEEMIPGAVGLRFDVTDEEIIRTLPDKDYAIVTYCANTHCTASPMLAKRLHDLGYSHVMEYPEGIAGWKAAGKPVQTAK